MRHKIVTAWTAENACVQVYVRWSRAMDWLSTVEDESFARREGPGSFAANETYGYGYQFVE